MITETINSNNLLDELLDSITREEQHRTDNRMLLAARIADAMQEKGISQIQLAQKLGKHHSVITKWLSGTQNFTIDTLSDIECALGINLFRLFEIPPIYLLKLSPKIQEEPVKPEHSSDLGYDTIAGCSSFSVKALNKAQA